MGFEVSANPKPVCDFMLWLLGVFVDTAPLPCNPQHSSWPSTLMCLSPPSDGCNIIQTTSDLCDCVLLPEQFAWNKRVQPKHVHKHSSPVAAPLVAIAWGRRAHSFNFV